MPHNMLHIYWCDENSMHQLIGTSAGNDSILLNGTDVDFMSNVLF